MSSDGGFRRLAVLIDGDNISSDLADHLFQEVAGLGIPRIRRVYGSDSSLAGWRAKAKHFWIGMHRVLPGKNAADIKLAIDAVDILHRQKVDGFCIVSSDRDFIELALHLRRDGAYVIGLGKSNAVASYRDACDAFFTLKSKAAPAVAPAKTSGSPGLSGGVAPKSTAQTDAPGEVVTSIERKQIEQKLKALAKGRQHVPVSELGNHIPKTKSGTGRLKTRLKAHGFTLVMTGKALMVEVPHAAQAFHFR